MTEMSRFTPLVFLLFAALLEAGGDAVIRRGLQTTPLLAKLLLFAAGGGMLLLYGCLVNSPKWTFGKLLGLYVVFFFLVAQVVSWLAFHQPPTRPLWAGGLLIVSGGLVIALGGG